MSTAAPQNLQRMKTRCAWAGRVAELARLLEEPLPFLAACAQRYEAAGYGPVGESEYRSWRYSWPALVEVLMRAGLADWQLYLEYGTPAGAGRFDALLLAQTTAGHGVLTVVELKQWSEAEVLPGWMVRRSDGQEVVHPVAQVAGYLAFIRDWLEAEETRIEARGLVLLHNATRSRTEALHSSLHEIPVLSSDDVREGTPTQVLKERLLAADLLPPDEQQVIKFEQSRWTPARRLLDHVADLLDAQQAFTLIGDQQEAYLRIRQAIQKALTTRSRVIVTVTGGPGSGKTVIAARLLSSLCRDKTFHPRYVSPSGTLIAQLRHAAGGSSAADLFVLPSRMIGDAFRGANVAILDEGQRLPRADRGGQLQQILQRVPIVVLFLDEQQIIRPREGITAEEVRRQATELGITVHQFALSGYFRCNGSRLYTQWIDDLLYGSPLPWTAADYDLALATDPRRLQTWIDHHTENGALARITAGFCWPWKRDTSQLLPEVSIPWTDRTSRQHRWQAPWNADKPVSAPTAAPHRNFWATHPGGHRQIGCIYTAQGLEYQYSGVILGPDLVHRHGTWQARPQHTHDSALKGLSPQEYLQLALNTYRVLLTRGTKATHIYAVDPETQDFLATLLPMAD